MLSLVPALSPPPAFPNTSRQYPISQIHNHSSKTHNFNLTLPSHCTTSPIFPQIRTGFSLFCSNSNMIGEIEDEFDFDDDDDDDVEDDEEDEEEFVPMKSMKKWLESRPRGFGEGKEYDTEVEDKLLDEMQQSREAQLANLNKLKNSPPQLPNSKNEYNLDSKASEVVPSGSRVRLLNLPRKKNIDRDLQRAFKGIPGIVNISPAVSGNKKTREPVCKGFAFVDLKSEEYAHRFAQIVSGQSISFGKIQKQIKCEVMNPKNRNSSLELPTDINPSLPLESVSSEENEDTNEYLEDISLSEQVTDIELITMDDSVSDMKSSQVAPKVGAKEKRQVKQKRPKAPKLNIPGSANRLKVKEKAMLSGVLSKYGA